MREILFKAKIRDTGDWIYGYFVKGERMPSVIFTNIDSEIPECFDFEEIDETTLCQYTGLTDKNGNKIWENDVVKKVDTNGLGWHRERNCKVSFDSLGCWLLTTEYGDGYWIAEFDREQLEVIGNIFDNPELLQ